MTEFKTGDRVSFLDNSDTGIVIRVEESHIWVKWNNACYLAWVVAKDLKVEVSQKLYTVNQVLECFEPYLIGGLSISHWENLITKKLEADEIKNSEEYKEYLKLHEKFKNL